MITELNIQHCCRMVRNALSISILLIVLLHQNTYAQKYINRDKLSWGFSFGQNYSNIVSSVPNNSKISNGLGFRMGVMMEYMLTDNFFFSPKLEGSYNQSKVIFTHADNSQTEYFVMPYSLELMAHGAIRKSTGKFKPYILLGSDFKLTIGKKESADEPYGTRPDVAFAFGFGVENVLRRFKLAPELRYSMGVLNASKHPNIPVMRYHNLTLAFIFKM